MITSTELHTLLSSTFVEAQGIIKQETGLPKGVILSTYYDGQYGKPGKELTFTIRNGFASDAIEVRGRVFWDVVAEFIRRVNFAKRQDNLQLGPPTIDQSIDKT